MVNFFLADANSIENSNAVMAFGQLVVWIVLGLAAMWVIANLARRVEMQVMPSIPILIAGGFVGLLVMGLLHHFGL